MARNKGKRSYPKMLANVLKAIGEMKDSRGSSMHKIVDQVSTGLGMDLKRGNKPRNVIMQVRKALRHGLQTGLIMQQGGKYQISVDDIGRGMDSKGLPIKEMRRRRRGRRGRKGGKGRKGRGRRRGRRGGHRRRRRSHSRSSVSETEISEANTEASDSNTSNYSDTFDALGRKAPKRRGKSKAASRAGSKRKRTAEDDKDNQMEPRDNNGGCGNADCLCNIKQELADEQDYERQNEELQDQSGGNIN